MLPMLRGLAVVLVLAMASGAAAAPRQKLTGEARLAKLLEGRVAGKPTNCVRLSDVRGSEIIDGVAAGLDAMHSAGVGHLDVKPDNVILRRETGAATLSMWD